MRKLSLLILLCAAGLACSPPPVQPFKPPPPEPEVEVGEDAMDIFSLDDCLPSLNLVEELADKITPDDKKYLEVKCGCCHELDRILWTYRAPRSVWEEVLSEGQHREMGLDWVEKERIYEIFQLHQ